MALKQNPENQLIVLRRWAAASTNTVVGEFIDEVSSKDTRPEKEKILKMLRLGEIDGVAFVKLDRWGRSMSELVLELEEFSKSGKCLFSLTEGIDLATSAGRFMAHILASMANFERDIIHERTLLGLARAKSQGRIIGRHPKDCGCGTVLENGKKHDGSVKPIRNDKNQIIGWEGLKSKQTPPTEPTQISEETEQLS